MNERSLEKTVKDVLNWFHEEYHESEGPVTSVDGRLARIDELCMRAFESSVDGEECVSICLHHGGHVILDALARHGVRICEVNDDPDCEKAGHCMKAYLGWFDDVTYASGVEDVKSGDSGG